MNPFDQHFTYRKLLRTTVSPVIMMIFTSIYGVVDGLFLSNFTSKTAFAAVNFILPYLMLFGGLGFMFGTGGSALIAKTLGEGDSKRANEIFSSLFWVSLLAGTVSMLVGLLLLRPAAILLGADGALLHDSLIYGRVYLLGVPACVLQFEFQNLYSTAGKPKLGLCATVASGGTNILLDALLVGVFRWGLVGAAFATILSQWLGGLIPIFYFGRRNTSLLRLVRTRIDFRAILKICSNGFSEVVNNLSISTVGMLYNVQLLHYSGDDGLAAYGVLMYVNFLFTAVFWGYIVGCSPLISYQYGAQNHTELKSLCRKSLVLILTYSVLMFAAAEIFAGPVVRLFVGYDPQLMELTMRGFRIFSMNFLFVGLSICSSSFFTALNNGGVSALLSFLRTFVFQIAAILLLPLFFTVDGIWLSLVAAEFLGATVGSVFILAYRHRYHY